MRPGSPNTRNILPGPIQGQPQTGTLTGAQKLEDTMTHTPLDKIHVEATNLILKQRGEIKRLEAEKAGLLNALDAITTLADSSGDDLIKGVARKATAKARP